ncbi:MAG: type II toxin-antitoxin system PemK/MazF family toxin [Spirochaetia bacterium]|nr:type II toxin-antitoxin system PemK/MazF family toxin [Spirochaetia bacterium]
MVIGQYDIWLVSLDPAMGHEIKKTRPALVISPDEMNLNIKTVIIAPMTTKSRMYPTRISCKLLNKKGFIVLDQIRTIDKARFIKKLGRLEPAKVKQAKQIIKEMLVD